MSNCPLCNVETNHVITTILRRGDGRVYHCESCDLGFLVSDQKTNYDSDYRLHASHHSNGKATTPQEIFSTYAPYQSERVRMVIPYIHYGESTILEIGASAGQFLTHFTEFCSRRCAIEPDTSCCDFMESIGIEVLKHWGDRFDIVCAFQTMEHTVDPVSFLKDIRQSMKDDGVAFIEVPNLNDALRSIWGIPEYERFYFHGDHNFYFTEKSLRLVAEKAGFSNPEIIFTQDYNLLNHIHWLTTGKPQETCHVGLGPVKVDGTDKRMAEWLSIALKSVHDMYVRTLVAEGKTSNLMMVLRAA